MSACSVFYRSLLILYFVYFIGILCSYCWLLIWRIKPDDDDSRAVPNIMQCWC